MLIQFSSAASRIAKPHACLMCMCVSVPCVMSLLNLSQPPLTVSLCFCWQVDMGPFYAEFPMMTQRQSIGQGVTFLNRQLR